jgi:DNA-binding transcriptional regulator YiaG
MNDLSLRERLERVANGSVKYLVPFGSPATVNLRWPADPKLETRTIDAMRALTQRHMKLSVAKRAIEKTLTDREFTFSVPKVESPAALKAELEAAGFIARIDMADTPVPDVKALREALGATQEQFAARFRIGLDVLQNWEQHVNEPSAVARNFLQMIATDPQATAELLWRGL